MPGGIANAVACFFLNLLRGAAVPVTCRKCGHQFKPFAEHKFTRFAEIMDRYPCPKCGYKFGLGEDAKSAKQAALYNPPGSCSKPAGSRIERSEPSEDTLMFFIPPSGSGGVLLFMGLFWTACMSGLFYLFFFHAQSLGHRPMLVPRIFVGGFTAVGVGLVYAGLRQKFSTYLVYLSAELVRVQRRLLLRATQDLKPAEVRSVKLVEFYKENETPVYGVEISAGLRMIRFGSALEDGEKRWLAWEIRDYLRRHGATEIPAEGET